MKKNSLEKQIAEAICDLNRWNVPRKLKGRLSSNPNEIAIAFDVLEAFVPKTKWLKVWRAQIDKRKTAFKAVAKDEKK